MDYKAAMEKAKKLKKENPARKVFIAKSSFLQTVIGTSSCIPVTVYHVVVR